MNTSQDQVVFFIFGRHGELSAREIDSYLKRNKIAYKTILREQATGKYILVNILRDFKPNIKHLGGTIKWGVIEKQGLSSNLNPDVLALFIKDKSRGLDSVTYGVNIWPSHHLESDFSLKTKKLLKEHHARFVPPQRLTTAKTLIKNKLLEFGTDINIFIEKGCFFVGTAVQAQDVDEYTRRDVGRPERSMKRGLMPPKLAQMMINLAELDDFNSPILDPFCGSGTILQEAYFMGYSNLIGADINIQALEQTQKNLKSLGVPDSAYKLINSDARYVNKKIASVGAVVTEPYLGPTALIKSKKQIEKINKSLENLYQETLFGIARILPAGRRMVMVVPIRDGFTPSLDPEKYGLTRLFNLKYHRPRQVIARNIIVLQKI